MPVLAILEVFTVFVVIVTVATQMIIPLWNDRPMFPIFNKRRAKLNNQLKTLREIEEEQKIVDELAEIASSITQQQEKQDD